MASGPASPPYLAARRHWLPLLLLALLPLQFISWAAAAAYCRHEVAHGSRHFGHHEHEHKAAGSDVALETADVALMAGDLAQLPLAVGLSRRTSRVIKQNLWVGLGVVALLIPATILGLNIGVAVLFHEGSTLLVVANALRLLAYSPPTR